MSVYKPEDSDDVFINFKFSMSELKEDETSIECSIQNTLKISNPEDFKKALLSVAKSLEINSPT